MAGENAGIHLQNNEFIADSAVKLRPSQSRA